METRGNRGDPGGGQNRRRGQGERTGKFPSDGWDRRMGRKVGGYKSVNCELVARGGNDD